MTDAKSRLRPLDRLETPDLWRRATTLDPRSEMDEVASGRRSSKRSVAGIVAGAATATLTPRPDMCPSPPSGSTPVCPLPFSEEVLTLRQAGRTGDTGVWSVAEARASGLDLPLAPGAVVPNDGTISARWQLPTNGDALRGFAASAGWEMGPGSPCEGGEL